MTIPKRVQALLWTAAVTTVLTFAQPSTPLVEAPVEFTNNQFNFSLLELRGDGSSPLPRNQFIPSCPRPQ